MSTSTREQCIGALNTRQSAFPGDDGFVYNDDNDIDAAAAADDDDDCEEKMLAHSLPVREEPVTSSPPRYIILSFILTSQYLPTNIFTHRSFITIFFEI